MKKGIILLAVIIAASTALAGCGGKTQSAAEQTTAPATTAAATQSGDMTEAQAKAAALKDANVAEADATFVKAVKKTEDGFTYYEIEFTTSTKKYTYKILTSNGSVKDKSVETYSGDAAGTASGSKITEAEAKAAALEIAELGEDEVTFTKCVLTTKNGVSVYKVEFKSGDTEYEYLLLASNGELYDEDAETNDGDTDDGDDNDDYEGDDYDDADDDNNDNDNTDNNANDTNDADNNTENSGQSSESNEE